MSRSCWVTVDITAGIAGVVISLQYVQTSPAVPGVVLNTATSFFPLELEAIHFWVRLLVMTTPGKGGLKSVQVIPKSEDEYMP